ncbi:MAG: COG1361 S-layer family protein [archaeon]
MGKRAFIFVVIAVLLTGLFATGTLAATATESQKIIITMLNQDPDPVEPGQTVDVRYKFENRGSSSADNVEVQILPQFPFSIYSGEPIQQIGTLGGRQMDEEGAVVKYTLRVASDAVEGTSEVRLQYRADGGPWIRLEPFDLTILRHQAILYIQKVETEPSTVAPGKETTVKMFLKNLATTGIKDISVDLGLVTVAATATSFSTIELPFSPIGSSTQKIIESIGPGMQEYVEYNLITDADAEAKVYKVPVSITYSDERGANYSTIPYIALVVSDVPSVSVSLDSSDIIKPGQKGSSTVQFTNMGLGKIKFLNVELAESDLYDILSSPEVYIGNIDSDDYETADFDLYVKDCDDECHVALPLSYSYMDANNNEYFRQETIDLVLYSSEQIEQLNLEQKSPAVGIIIVVVVVVIGLFLYGRWRKRKNKNKE